jgi:glycine betaine/proline transport system substrate-binding protein
LWSALALITAFALVLTACGGAATQAPKPTIKLAENAWTGSSVNVHVAKILLEKLGYPVEIVTIDENAQWASLAKGDLSASLELWPSGHAENIKQYIDEQKVVENAGPLGVVGKIGWYIPTYMVDKNPELATWEGLKQDAAMFKTAETGDAGQFLAGDPSWVQYDGDVIKNLDLNFKVVSVGSEQAVLAAVDAAYSRNDPVLFYFWTPHSVHAKYKLTEVKLPDYSDACYAKASAGGIDCDYPPDALFKIVWGDLKTKAPEAYQLLKNFKYTNADQIGMIAAVEVNGKTADAAAQEWVDKNEATWTAWMPTN